MNESIDQLIEKNENLPAKVATKKAMMNFMIDIFFKRFGIFFLEKIING